MAVRLSQNNHNNNKTIENLNILFFMFSLAHKYRNLVQAIQPGLFL